MVKCESGRGISDSLLSEKEHVIVKDNESDEPAAVDRDHIPAEKEQNLLCADPCMEKNRKRYGLWSLEQQKVGPDPKIIMQNRENEEEK